MPNVWVISGSYFEQTPFDNLKFDNYLQPQIHNCKKIQDANVQG